MPGEQAASISDSLSKKRARDRRAQHNLRRKRDAHIVALQQRIAELENELHSLRQGCYGLRRENELLKGRQSSISHLVSSWADPVLPNVDSPRISFPITADANGLPVLGGGDATLEGVSLQGPNSHSSSVPSRSPTRALEATRPRLQIMQDLTSRRWEITPVHLDSDIVVTDFFGLCIRKPDMVCRSPDLPRPIELLYGSKTNVLAHSIYSAVRQWPCRDPERLATGWLAYRFLKWISQPSESSFSLLQDFQHPVSEQLCSPHPYFIDFVMWPKLRVNLINNQHLYDTRDIVGMLTCCLKVRWPWNEPILEPADDGELILRADFRETFTNLEGWGLTKEFWDRFPLLCEDLGIESVRYDFT